MAKTQLGIDIGTSELKIAQCDTGGLRRCAVEPLPSDLVRDGRIVSFEAMGDFLKATVRKHRISGRDCAVVLPSGHAFLRRVLLPAMSVEQLKVNLPYEFRDYLTQGKDRYFYDYAVNSLRTDESGTPVELDLTGAAVEKQLIADYSAMLRRAGLRLRVAAPTECAYANLLRAYGSRVGEAAPAEACILDLGHTAARIHIFSGCRFETTRVIEIGQNTVDRALADLLSVDEFVARSHKESNLNDAQTQPGPKSIYGSIAVEIMKAVNFYGFNNRESNLQHAYYCGGGAEIPAMMEAISAAVNLTLHPILELLPASGQNAEAAIFCAAAAGITMQ